MDQMREELRAQNVQKMGEKGRAGVGAKGKNGGRGKGEAKKNK